MNRGSWAPGANPASTLPDPCGDATLDTWDALAILLRGVTPLPGEDFLSPMEASGRVLRRDFLAPTPLPPFRNSAMDGFLLHADDLARQAPFTLPLAGRRVAGSSPGEALEPGTTLRILTGAPIPTGGGALLYDERCEQHGDRITFHDTPRPGANIRLAGEDAAAGIVLLRAGTRLEARHLALAGAAGNAALPLHPKVRLGLLSTGSELVPPGMPLRPGQIHDSNRPMLAALLGAPFVDLHDLGAVGDHPAALRAALEHARGFDVLLTTGAVAGSEADHLPDAFRAAGGEVLVQRLALRPGKPLLHGRLGRARVLGFGGNPMAGFVGAAIFAVPLLRALAGLPAAAPTGIPAHLDVEPTRRRDRREFRPATILEHTAEGPLLRCLGPGSSARLLPLVEADGMAELLPGEPLGVRFHSFASLSLAG